MEYKYVVLDGAGRVLAWKPGANFALQLGGDGLGGARGGAGQPRPNSPAPAPTLAVDDAWDGARHDVQALGALGGEASGGQDGDGDGEGGAADDALRGLDAAIAASLAALEDGADPASPAALEADARVAAAAARAARMARGLRAGGTGGREGA